MSSILSSLSPDVHADLNLVTLEGLLNGTAAKHSNVSFPAEAADAVGAGGFDMILLNHENVLDSGVDALKATVAAAKSKGLSSAGVSVDGAQPKLFNVNGVSGALLCYTETLSAKGKETLKQNLGTVALLNGDQIVADITAARAQGAKVVVVSLHWGKTDAKSITNAQKETAKKLAQAGADVIIGANTAAVLPIEMIQTTDSNGTLRKTLVAYSLGTLLNDDRSSRSVISGVLLHIRFHVTNRGVTMDEITYTPTYIWKQKINGKTAYRVLNSAAEAPAEMNDDQKKYMSNALALIDKTLADGPANRR